MSITFTDELLNSTRGTPSLGCRYCDRGTKMVLCITGNCMQDCFYCPLSEKKKGKDVIYANERLVEGEGWLDQIIDEAERMRALGTGLTGGDPMIVPERTEQVIRGLMERFGKRHHIHLYTTGPFDRRLLKRMKDAGLREIRFHPPIKIWDDFSNVEEQGPASPYHELIREAREVGLVIGLEIPAVVDGNGEKSCYSRGLFHLVEYAVREGLDLVNINELEASHTNMDALVERGYELVGDSMAVAGSRELAMDVIDRISKKYPKSRTSLHFCSSVYKDSIQLRHRLRRMAKNLKRPFEIDTEDGTLVRGTVVTEDPEGLMSRLESDAGVPEELMEAGDGELLIAAWVLEEIAPDLDENCFISEVYPTWDGLEVERTPIG